MFGHRSLVVVLSLKKILPSAESSVPTKHVPEELTESLIWKRAI